MTVLTEQSSAANVVKLVKTAIGHVGKARDSVQMAAVAIIEHANAFGDCSQAKVLARGVPSRERNSLVGYFMLFSPIGVAMGKTAADDKCRFVQESTVTKFRTKTQFPGAEKLPLFAIPEAKANMWYDDPSKSNPEPKPLNTTLDFYTIIDKMLKKAIKDADDPTKTDPEAKTAIKDQASALIKMVGDFRAKHLPAKVEDSAKLQEKIDEQELEQAV